MEWLLVPAVFFFVDISIYLLYDSGMIHLPKMKKKMHPPLHPQLEDIPQPKPFPLHTRQIMKAAQPLLTNWEERFVVALGPVPQTPELLELTARVTALNRQIDDYHDSIQSGHERFPYSPARIDFNLGLTLRQRDYDLALLKNIHAAHYHVPRVPVPEDPRATQDTHPDPGYQDHGDQRFDLLRTLAEQNPSVDFHAGGINRFHQHQSHQQPAHRTGQSDDSIEVHGRTLRDYNHLGPAQREMLDNFHRRYIR